MCHGSVCLRNRKREDGLLLRMWLEGMKFGVCFFVEELESV